MDADTLLLIPISLTTLLLLLSDGADDEVQPPRDAADEALEIGASLPWKSDVSMRMLLADVDSFVSDVCARVGLVGEEDGSESVSE